ncbi:MAG: 6,7-dimethyl-8-ribityllumazine synthase [Verrucomicrobia bacterium]|nr:6,7-dimethyl-8-ribityllumazine synthase [Verrucomicrobiota bacterium]MDA1085554.1 6,7-dimethyl-8-ribityllumazine synthase [Verrucomicrobiota bacterium]
MKELSANLVATGLKFGIVVSRFNDTLTGQMLQGATECFLQNGAAEEDLLVAWVPGSDELPLAAGQLARDGNLHAIIVLGVVIEGDTAHADLITTQVSRSVAEIARETNLPVLNGVIAARTLDQATDRASISGVNRGRVSALAAIEMANLYQQIRDEFS